MAESLRNATMKISWIVDSNPLKDANKQADNAISTTKKLSDAIDKEKKSQEALGSATQQTSNQQKAQNKQLTETQQQVTDLTRKLDLSKAALKASTAGLSDMGKSAKAAKVEAANLGTVMDLQKAKIAALKTRLDELKNADGDNTTAIHKMNMAIVENVASLNKMEGKLAATSKEANHARASFINTADKAGSFGANYLMTVSAPIAAGMGLAIKSALEFQKKMTDIKSLMQSDGESAQKAGQITSAMLSQGTQLSSKYGVSVNQIGDAYEMMIRKGDSGTQAMAAVEKMLKASTAAGSDFMTTTQVSMNVMEQFYGKAKTSAQTAQNTTKVTNAMAYAADHGSAKFIELGYSMNYVGDYAKSVGYNMEDMAGYIELMSRRGIEGTSAGTGLRGVIASLVKPSKQAAAEMKDIGLTTKDAHGNLLRLSDIMQQLRDKTDNMGTGDRGMVLSTLFGRTSLPTVTALMTQTGQQMDAFSSEIKAAESNDYAGTVAKRMMNSAQNNLNQFKATLNSLGVELGNKLLPYATSALKTLTNATKWFSSLNNTAKNGIIITGLVVGAGVPLIIGLGKIAASLMKIKDFMDRSRTSFSNYRKDMVETAVAASDMATAEDAASNAGSGLSGGISSTNKKGGILSRIFKGKGAASGAASVAEDAATIGADAAPVVEDVAKGGKFLKFAGTAGKLIGGATIVGDVANSANDLVGINKQNAGNRLGDLFGNIGGGAIGAAIGTAIAPGIGTAVGGALGSWLGSKGGQYLGNAIQHPSTSAPHSKITAGDVTMMNAGMPYQQVVTAKAADPAAKLSTSVKQLAKDYNTAQGSIDDTLKTIAVTGSAYSKQAAQSVDNAYNSIVRGAKSAATAQENATKGHLNLLVKDGLMSASAAAQDEKTQTKQYNTNVSLAQDAAKQLTTLNDTYYSKMKTATSNEESEISAVKKKYTDKNGVISETGEQKITQIEQKYNDDRRGISSKYAGQRNALEKTLKSDVAVTLSASAAQQKIILGKLRDDSGKLSAQQATTIVDQAKKARDGAISAANDKYKKAMAAADQEYYVTGTISKSQYEDTVKKARAQRDDSVNAANEQWHSTVDAANKQMQGTGKYMDQQTGKIHTAWFSGILPDIASAVSWLGKLFGISTDTKAPSGASGKSKAVAYTASTIGHGRTYAVGTAPGGHPGGNAILGDGGKPELWITPQGQAGISPAIPTLYRNMPSGTQVLSGDDTEKAMGMRAYASGTGGFWSSISSLLGQGFNWLKNGASSAASWVMNKFGLSIPGDVGDLTHFTQTVAWPAIKNMMGSAISNLVNSFGSSMGDIKGVNIPGNAKAWISAGMRLAGVSGANWANGLATIAQHESGGNPNAVNRWDSNAKAGHPSAGLMQMIQSTFMANAVSGHTQWMNPIDQVAASVRYIEHRYGGINRVPGIVNMTKGGRYVGYANGTPGAGALINNLLNKNKGNQQTNVAVNHHSKAMAINPNFNITINVNGNEQGMNESKLARTVRDEVEKLFNELRQNFDGGLEY